MNNHTWFRWWIIMSSCKAHKATRRVKRAHRWTFYTVTFERPIYTKLRNLQLYCHNVVVTCEIKLFQNYLCLRRRPSEIFWEICLKLFQNYFTWVMQLMNILQQVQRCWDNFEIISELFQRLKVKTEIILRLLNLNVVSYDTNTKIILKLFQWFISHVTKA